MIDIKSDRGFPYVFGCFMHFILASSVLWFGCSASLAQTDAPVVEVAHPLEELIVDWDEYTGRFQARQQVEIASRVSGFVQSISFREGQLIEAGDLLYVIDQRPFEIALQQAQARLAVSRATLEFAEIEFNRASTLAERNVGAQSEVERTSAEFARARANVDLATADLKSAELQLEYSEILAPIGGRISATNVDVGDLVVGGVAGGQTLTTIVSLDPIEFLFSVSEADFIRYTRLDLSGERRTSRTEPNPVSVRLSDEASWSHAGHMEFVENTLDPNSGTLIGRAIFENADHFFQPGLFGRLRLLGSGEYTAVLIPDEAVVADQASSIVYVVDDQGIVERRQIETGGVWQGLRIVTNGISKEDLVVVAGIQRARPGGPVSPEIIDLTLFNRE